jgi:hypothetical protein
MIVGLGERIGDKVEPPNPSIPRERSRPLRPAAADAMCTPAAFASSTVLSGLLIGLTKRVIRPFEARSQNCADQHPVAELQLG